VLTLAAWHARGAEDRLLPESGPYLDRHPYQAELARALVLSPRPIVLMVVVPSSGSEQAVYVEEVKGRPQEYRVVWTKIEGLLWELRGFGRPEPHPAGPDFKPQVSVKEALIAKSTVDALVEAWHVVLRDGRPHEMETWPLDGVGFHFADATLSGWAVESLVRRPKVDGITELGFRLIKYVMAAESEREALARDMARAGKRLRALYR